MPRRLVPPRPARTLRPVSEPAADPRRRRARRSRASAREAARRTGAGPRLCVSLAREVVDAARARAESPARWSTRAAVAGRRRRRGRGRAGGRCCTRWSTPPACSCTPTSDGRRSGAARWRRGQAVGGAYSNLEYRLDDGGAAPRHDHAGALLARACGAEAALVVNNDAAAVLLVLAALAAGPARSSCPGASWWRSAAGSGCPR